MGGTPQLQGEYDYIVCAGGTSGCVVAARLAEDGNARILLLEAGPDGKDNENIKMVGGWSKNFDAETDWNLITSPMDGKFLGGCSGVNGTLCIRGCKQDYDDWKLPGWSGEVMFAYMRKSETFHSKPWFNADKSAHGYEGPLHIEPHDLAPISRLMLLSMESKGLPLVHDMFSTGETANGCGHAPRTHHKGIRSLGQTFVEVVGKSGEKRTMSARKEIIISGGSYCSPNVLRRSGIDPKAELDALGINCLVDLPGVGKNLLDHLIVFTFYECTKDGLTDDHFVYHDDAAIEAYRLYKESKTGVLSTFPFGAFAFARLDDRLKDEPLWQEAKKKVQDGRDLMGLTPAQPHIEFFTTELYGGPKQYTDYTIDKKHAFAMITELFSPHSKGIVSLKSADPFENPIVDCNYLANPLDLLVLSEGVRYGNEIVMQGQGTKDEATTCYHAAGSCKMGQPDDLMAVLDATLNVRGTKSLRVADCSVMPKLRGGHTQMPAYGTGEKAADLIEADVNTVKT
ncbi:GMC oxidoreductase [Polychaeton citri CBS 116435]|uniref:GMC oxidoreductase n=1 Tax=Polychaeton citri CBS 116435 TaxID=1314669 RepID=A0A9P4Q5A2_9PEZI|nr:GMC oxidoreductase [Polychaeton citri CBS 116435]